MLESGSHKSVDFVSKVFDGRKAGLVSVIMPSHNSEAYIEQAIRSVLDQTHQDLELIITDDGSTDSTYRIAKALADQDSRIDLAQHAVNQGAASARNSSLRRASGRYIAYLDSDDVWASSKIKDQIEFMSQRGAAVCFTAYETIEADGQHRNFVKVPEVVDYRGFLKNTVSCSHTIIFDSKYVAPDLLVMPPLKRGQDAATWLTVLRDGHTIVGLNIPLAQRRDRKGSLSSNRLTAVRRTWYLYRQVENLGYLYSLYCLAWQVSRALKKRLPSFGMFGLGFRP